MSKSRALLSMNVGDGHGGIRVIAAGDLLDSNEGLVKDNPDMFEAVDVPTPPQKHTPAPVQQQRKESR